jgi:hypothetical protein
MPAVDLQPVAKSEESLLSYIDINFRRIVDALAALASFQQGIQAVTGSVVIDTGLALVDNVIASLNSAPAAGACFVRAYPVGSSSPSDIQIDVYSNAFAISAVAVNVSWVAIGE